MRPLSLLFAAFLLFAAEAQAQLTTGTLTVSPLFESLGIKAALSGTCTSCSAVVEYKKSSDSTWITVSDTGAHIPYIDTRATINGSANPYANQARMAIPGLIANTSYDVRVTWSDGVSVSGGNPVIVSNTSTFSRTPTTGTGTPHAASSVSDINNYGASAAPGDTINIAAGTYSNAGGFTFSANGNPSNWILVSCAAGANLTGGTSQDVSITGTYIVFSGCNLPSSLVKGIDISGQHIFIQNNALQAVSSSTISTDCGTSAGPPAAGNGASIGYSNTGIGLGSTATDIYIFNNSITASTALDTCTAKPVSASPATGISFGNSPLSTLSNYVICDNTVTGGFRDAITSDSAVNYEENVDICRNTVTGYKDDGLESKGSNVNVRIWGDTGPLPPSGRTCPNNTNNVCDSATCVAANTVANGNNNQYGPLFIFRNDCTVTTTTSSGQTVYKLGGVRTYLFHNTVNAHGTGTGSGNRWDGIVDASGGADAAYGGHLVARNNLMDTEGNSSIGWESSSDMNYDFFRKTSATAFAKYPDLTSQSSFANLKTAGQEANGVCGGASGTTCPTSPSYATGDAIASNSPAANAGVAINGFNGSNTLWPYTTANPSIGFYEANAGACTPDHFVITSQPNASTPLSVSIGTIQASLVNVAGQACSSATNSVTLQIHAGSAFAGLSVCTTTANASGGIVTFTNCQIVTTPGTGSFDLVASGLTTGTTNTITITSPTCTPAKVVFTSQPTGAPTGQPLGTFVVTVEDSGNNPCPAATNTIALSAHSGATFSGLSAGTGGLARAATSGAVIWSNVYATGAGTGSLDANAAGLTGATSSPFTVTAVVAGAGGRFAMKHRGK